MTVEMLIRQLQAMPQDLTVCLSYDDGAGCCEINAVRFATPWPGGRTVVEVCNDGGED
jgi:hypothetical protein